MGFIPFVPTAGNVTIPLPIADGGTGTTTAAAAFNTLSPMTTTGDLEYESAANTASRLAGNTTSTKNFLTQTGNGSVSAAPIWGTIAEADMPISEWWANDSGYAAWAFDSAFQSNAGTSRLITTNVLNLIGLQVRTSTTVSKMDLYVINAGTSLTSGQCFFGLYNSSGSLVAQSVDQSGVWNSAGFKTGGTFTASAAVTPGLYWAALLANGTTMPSFSAVNDSGNITTHILNGNAAVGVARYATNNTSGTGYASLPSSFTPGSNVGAQVAAWWTAIY
jgi:hypothetical protein